MAKKERATAPTVAPQIENSDLSYSHLEQVSSQNPDVRKNPDDLSLHEAILGLVILLDDPSLIWFEKSLCGVMLRNGICQLINRSRGA